MAARTLELTPRVPVVGPTLASKAHPAEVVALLVGGDDSRIDFAANARTDQGRDAVEFIFKQVKDPGEGAGGFGGKRGPRWVRVRVGQADARLLGPDVGREGPRRFFTDGPNHVGERIEEASLPLHALRQGQPAEQGTALEPPPLKAVAIAFPPKFQIEGLPEGWAPAGTRSQLPMPGSSRGRRRGIASQGIALGGPGEGMPLGGVEED